MNQMTTKQINEAIQTVTAKLAKETDKEVRTAMYDLIEELNNQKAELLSFVRNIKEFTQKSEHEVALEALFN